MAKKFWTKQERQFVKDNFLKLNDTEIGRVLGRNKSSVRRYRSRQNFKRPPHVQKTLMAKNHFKMNNTPKNTKYNGCITIRRHNPHNSEYKYIRIAKGHWIPYHHFVWEKDNGPIPEGYVLRFKNGDTLDCNPENLELIHREENLKRNRNSKKGTVTRLNSDAFVASRLAMSDKGLRKEILDHGKDLIELKKRQYLMNYLNRKTNA